jgi:hypothetical protein
MTDHVVRVLRVVAAAMLVIGSLPLSSHSEVSAQPAQEAPPTGTGGPAPAGAAGPTGASTGARSTPDVAQSKCETGVAALIGKGSAALHDLEVKALAKRMPSLVACGAVLRDSDEPCDLLSADDAKSCRKTRLNFHALRDPKSHGFVFSDAEYRECEASIGATVCDAIRAAIRSGDPNQCPSKQPFGAVCRATITLDPALCPEEGAEECRREVEHWKVYATGLQGLKKSGSAEERVLAAAALGEPDACKPIAQSALDSCAATAAGTVDPRATSTTAPPSDGEAGGTPAATTPPH